MRRAWLVVALLAACGDDDSGSGTTRDGGGGGIDSGSGSGSDSGGGGSLFLSGTSCEGPVSYSLGGDEKILVYATEEGLRAIFVMDGPLFDNEVEAEWATYAQSYDTFFVIGVSGYPPLEAQTIPNTFDSMFGGRNTGVMGFAEDGTESVQITAVDTVAKTIAVTFTFPVWGSTTVYPPGFDTVVECRDTTPGSVTGSFSGTYELLVP